MKKLVIFDLDGLLIDTERMYYQTWKETFMDANLYMPDEILLSTAGKALKDTKQIISDTFNDSEIFDILREKREIKFWDKAAKSSIPVKEGAQELIDYLKDKNITMALASSTQTDRAKKLLSFTYLKLHFEMMVFGDMVKHTKPNPEIFNLIMNQLNFSTHETIILEDSYSGVKAANNAGVDVYWVKDMIDLSENDDVMFNQEFDTLKEVIPYIARII